jgi:hypothetical protein
MYLKILESATIVGLTRVTYSILEIKFGGFAFKTTNIRIGTKLSAFSSLCKCLIRPVYQKVI